MPEQTIQSCRAGERPASLDSAAAGGVVKAQVMAIVLVIGVFLLAPNLLIQVLPGLTAAVVGGAAREA